MLNKKQILGLCLASFTVLINYFLPSIIFFGGYMIFLPIYIIGVILIIVGSIIQIKESSKEKSLSVSNSVHANKKIIVSSIVIAITLGYLSLQALEVYKAYSGMNESRREAENAAAAAQKRAEEGQVNKVDGNTPTSYQFH